MTLVLHRESSVCHTSVGFGVRIILWLTSFFDLLHLLIYIMYVLEVQIYRSSERAEFRIEDNQLRFKRRLIDNAISTIICAITLTLGDQFNSSNSAVFFGQLSLLVRFLHFGVKFVRLTVSRTPTTLSSPIASIAFLLSSSTTVPTSIPTQNVFDS